MSFRKPRSKVFIPAWGVDMAETIPDTVNGRRVSWLADHDWQIGVFLCAVPVFIGIVLIMFALVR